MKKRILLSIIIICMLSVHVAAFASDAVFRDIKESDWFYDDVLKAWELGIVEGIGGGKYAPDKVISYAEYITVLVRALELDTSNELKGEHWASQYMHAAQKAGIITREELLDLDYNAGIPRQDMVRFSCNALGIKTEETSEYIFEDVKEKSEDEIKYINAAFNEYLTEGIGRTPEGLRIFGYDKESNRAELATMALRIRAYKENPEEYKTERAAAREAADREWQEKHEAESQGKELSESEE